MPDDNVQRAHSGSGSSQQQVSSALKPFFDTLSTSSSHGSGQRTPVAPGAQSIDYGTPTPKQLSSGMGTSTDLDGEETADEDEFESHYSRQSSSASSSAGSDLDDDSEAQDEKEDQNSDNDDKDKEEKGDDLANSDGTDSFSMNPMHRVSSLPPTTSPRDSFNGNHLHNRPLHSHPHSHTHSHSHSNHLHLSRSATSLSRVAPPIPPPLYPPFYNRPPTPLPPSPSLTSLLRPPSLLNRSTTSTRPTTPDSSDAETPNDTEAAVAHSARRANPLPPTAPKVPTYEYYGFVLYLASFLAFVIYILWSYLPSPFLRAFGITYYPNRWWSLAIPAWIVVVLVYVYVALACWNVEYMTLGLANVETIVDDAGSVAILDAQGRLVRGGSKKFVAALEEKRKRDRERDLALSTTAARKGKSGSARSKRERKRREEKEKGWEKEAAMTYYGYMGDVSEDGSGVSSGLAWRQIWNEGTDAVMDVPLGGVCQVLYGEHGDVL